MVTHIAQDGIHHRVVDETACAIGLRSINKGLGDFQLLRMHRWSHMQDDISAGNRAIDRIGICHVAHEYFGRTKCQEAVGLLRVTDEGSHVRTASNQGSQEGFSCAAAGASEHDHQNLFFRTIGSPPWGRIVTSGSSLTSCPSTGSSVQVDATAATTSTASIKAKSLPIHRFGPAPNGM